MEIVQCLSVFKGEGNFPSRTIVGAQGLGAACHIRYPVLCLTGTIRQRSLLWQTPYFCVCAILRTSVKTL